MYRFFTIIFMTCVMSLTGLTQTTISGPAYAEPGSQHEYIVNFESPINPYTYLYWNVSGGTIIQQEINPTATVIKATVVWDTPTDSGAIYGNINIYEDVGAQYGELPVEVGYRTQITCEAVGGAFCTAIMNAPFEPNTWNFDPSGPFNDNIVGSWYATHGTPQLNLWGQAFSPVQGTSYAAMWAWSGQGEGIAAKIPALVQGHTYRLTFYRWVYNPNTNSNATLDEINVALTQCANFNDFSENAMNVPNLNAFTNQRVYCETNAANGNFQRISICFTASSNWNEILFFPREGSNSQMWLSIAVPELIDVTPFTAGPAPTVLSSTTCNVTIGPSTPNCGPFGASFYWKSPSNQTYPVTANNQQLTINSNTSYGTWTLYMTVPNTTTTNSNCASQTCTVSATVNVPQCTITCTPTISPGGPIDYYYFWEAGSPTIGITLTSDVPSSSQQWYRNGVAISGATGATYKAKLPGDYTVVNNGCTSAAVTFNAITWGSNPLPTFGYRYHPSGINSPSSYCNNTTSVIRQFDQGSSATYYWETYESYNTPQQPHMTISQSNIHSYEAVANIGWPSVPTYTNVLGYGVTSAGYVKAMEFGNHFYTPFTMPPMTTCPGTVLSVVNYDYNNNVNMNPGASGFEWETYDFGPNSTIITPNPASYPNPADPTNTHKIRIPGRGLYSGGITVSFSSLPATFNRVFYNGSGGEDCYTEARNINAHPSCRVMNPGITLPAATIYPNPASSQIRIQSEERIESAEISSSFYPFMKRVPGNGTNGITAEISEMPPGVYTCKIVTRSGTQYVKFLIQR